MSAEAMNAAGQPILNRRIEFHLARRPCTGVPLSSGDFLLETLNPDSSYKGRTTIEPSETEGMANGKRLLGGEFHELGLDPELNFRISFQKIGAGLENLGNTCYLNSVLQCLTYTEPFAAYLQSGKHKTTCRAAGFCAMCALQNHVMDALQSTGKILKPFHLVKNLRCISRSFQNSRQEDAHEYMVNLLESMHKCCLPYGVPSESPSAYEKSLVHKIFGGQLRSQVKCMQCSYSSNTFDPFLDLSLEIVGADSLRKALAHFTASEQLDDGEKQYQCQHCKEKVRAFKQLTIHKVPYVLTIHLKRFGSCIRGEKINKKIEFGSTLDLKPFVSDLHEEELKYTLYGVLVHAGWSTHSGHYFCYVRTSAGLWYSLDDNRVSQVSEKTVLSREAYMLFYVRDRATIKGPLEVNFKTKTSTNSTGNISTPSAERKLNSPVYSLGKVRREGFIHGLPISLVNNPGKHLLKNQEPPVQSKAHATTRDSCNKVSDDVVVNGLCKKMLPKDKTEILVSANSMLPSFVAKNGNATNKSVQDAATQQKMVTTSIIHCTDYKKSLSPSSAINGPIKEDARSNIIEDEADGCDAKKSSTSQQCQKGSESFLKLREVKPGELVKLNTTVSNYQVESSAVPEIENLIDGCHQTGVMLKKSKISLLAKCSYFGRKQFFLMSLRLHKRYNKKQKRKNQRFRNKINKRILDPDTDSQGASTSKMYTTDSMHSMCSSGKNLDSTTRKKSKKEKGVKSGINYNQINNKEIHGSCANGDMPGISEEPSRFSGSTEVPQNVKFKISEDKDILSNCPLSLLKESLREATVAKWDVENLQASQLNELDDAPKRKNGYLLDEWDEEYDRGKRKKLKSRQWFNGPNVFQELADLKAQQKIMKFPSFEKQS